MRLLIADDDATLRLGLQMQLKRWGYEPIACADGLEARAVLQGPQPPRLAILDWSMPGADGVTLCREVRETPAHEGTYIILLTANDTREQMVTGLDGGADDYIVKPFDWGVLRARLKIGARITTLQQSLAQRVSELESALDMVKKLSGLLPICSYCKRIREGEQYFQLESYLSAHSEAEFSHGICPECLERARREFGV